MPHIVILEHITALRFIILSLRNKFFSSHYIHRGLFLRLSARRTGRHTAASSVQKWNFTSAAGPRCRLNGRWTLPCARACVRVAPLRARSPCAPFTSNVCILDFFAQMRRDCSSHFYANDELLEQEYPLVATVQSISWLLWVLITWLIRDYDNTVCVQRTME